MGRQVPIDILIHSSGGVLTACYQIAQFFSKYTESWEAIIPSYAMSGATLICLGSSNIVFSDVACIGPIDPQVISRRSTKFFAVERQSPLEAFQALKHLTDFSVTELDSVMSHLLGRGVAPQTALEVASKMAAALVDPVLNKLDPYDLGAFQLDSNLAREYCRRICDPADKGKITQRKANYRALVEQYPAHEFRIDIAEAQTLGIEASEADQVINELLDNLRFPLGNLSFYIGLVPPYTEAH